MQIENEVIIENEKEDLSDTLGTDSLSSQSCFQLKLVDEEVQPQKPSMAD